MYRFCPLAQILRKPPVRVVERGAESFERARGFLDAQPSIVRSSDLEAISGLSRFEVARQVRARGGKIVLISDAKGIEEAGEGCIATIEMPEVHPLIAPIVYAVPVQLLAYHVAVLKGTDVDQPRNLAKSVTVE